jgi:hypothetical protein
MNVTVLLHCISLRITLCSRRSSIRVQTRRVSVSNEDCRVGNREEARSIGITLLREILYTLPEACTSIASTTWAAITDKVQVEGEVLVRVIEAIVCVLGTLLYGLIGSKHFCEVRDYWWEVVRVVVVSGVVGVFSVTASSVETFVLGVAYGDISCGSGGGCKRACRSNFIGG